jgi:hypothetical protein
MRYRIIAGQSVLGPLAEGQNTFRNLYIKKAFGLNHTQHTWRQQIIQVISNPLHDNCLSLVGHVVELIDAAIWPSEQNSGTSK